MILQQPQGPGGIILQKEVPAIVNTNMEAIKEDGKPVGGLYVVGNDSGGFISNSYPQLFGGTAHGRTVCFARLAALHACTGSIYET